MSRFSKGNHDIVDQQNRKDKHGALENPTSRLPHKARRKMHRRVGTALLGLAGNREES